MISKESLQIFREIAANNKDGDLYLKILSVIINYTGRYDEMPIHPLLDSISTEVSPLLTEKNISDKDFKDLRLKMLEFRYFRSFPAESDTNFGLQFQKDGNPCSTFLVGNNSTGKSTIFDAIEYYYAHKLSNAEIKSIPEKVYEQYLTYGFGQINGEKKITSGDVRLIVKTQAEKRSYRLGELNNSFCTSAMFCSENDIYNIEKVGNGDLEQFFFEQLGYADLKTILDRLKELVVELKRRSDEQDNTFLEPKDIERVIQVFMDHYYHNREWALKQCELYLNIIKEKETEEVFRTEISQSDNFFAEEWKELRNSILYSDFPYMDAEVQGKEDKIELKYELLKEALSCGKPTDANDLFKEEYSKSQQALASSLQEASTSGKENEDILQVLRKIISDLGLAIQGIVSNFVEQYGKFIEGCLAYFSEKGESFRLGNDLKMHIHVDKDEGSFDTFPAEYLNAFRFKLYAISLKLSLAFWYMKKNCCVLPVAIDDVFNANDFDNSRHLQHFVHTIYELYHDKVCADKPLQLIMLTHDEIILNAFRKGFNVNKISRWGEPKEEAEKHERQYRLYKDNCIVGRIFAPEKAKKIYHQGGSPINLYYKLK